MPRRCARMRCSSRERGREIGHHHVEPVARRRRSWLTRAPSSTGRLVGPPISSCTGPLAAVPVAHLAADRAELRLRAARPSPRARRTTSPTALDHRAFDGEAEVVPAVLAGRREIGVLDVEPAEHRHLAVGDDDLLVVADQVARGSSSGMKQQNVPARLDQRRRRTRRSAAAPKPSTISAHVDPAPRRRGQRVAHRARRIRRWRRCRTRSLRLLARAVDQRRAAPRAGPRPPG